MWTNTLNSILIENEFSMSVCRQGFRLEDYQLHSLLSTENLVSGILQVKGIASIWKHRFF
jgi:hypothetical protein